MRRKNIFIIILVLASFVLASCSSQQREVLEQTITEIVNKDLSEQGSISPEDKKITLIVATVKKVIDGDTLHVDMDGITEKVRLIGVDTPETVHPQKSPEPFGLEASLFAKERLAEKQIWLELPVCVPRTGRGVQERCRYDRLLAYVWLEKPVSATEEEVRSKMFNALLVLEGLAQVATFPPNVKYAEMFVLFQEEAREANKGLWEEEEETLLYRILSFVVDFVLQHITR